MKAIARGLAHVAMFTVAAALLAAASLFVMGAYLTTWPILRKSPRERHLKTGLDLAAAGMAFLSTFQEQFSKTATDVDTDE